VFKKFKLLKISLVFLLIFVLVSSVYFTTVHIFAASVSIENGIQFTDTSGNVIHAHGGGMLKYGNYYYWYGEYRDDSNYFLGVRCYRSSDLRNWEFRGEVLKPSAATEINKCNIERPKVIYNSSTNQFVMWMHWENGSDYGEARAAVAYCNSPDGNFTYQGSFRPYANSGVTDHGKAGYMSRDCNLFVDTDGKAYFISSSNENMDLHLYRLTFDYRNIDTLVTKLFVGSQREAPCLIKRNNYYYLITSGCTGWSPNQAKYSYSTDIGSNWSSLNNLGNSTTYDSQSTCIMPIQGSGGTSYLYMGDRWAGAWGGKVNDSKYIWLPLLFNSDTSLSLSYADNLNIDVVKGEITLGSFSLSASKYYKLVNRNSGKLLAIQDSSTLDGAVAVQMANNGGTNQQWKISDLGNGNYKVINRNSNKLLEVNGWSTVSGAKIDQWSDNNGGNQKWSLGTVDNGFYKISNVNSAKLLDVKDASRNDGIEIIQWTDTGGANQQWQFVETN